LLVPPNCVPVFGNRAPTLFAYFRVTTLDGKLNCKVPSSLVHPCLLPVVHVRRASGTGTPGLLDLRYPPKAGRVFKKTALFSLLFLVGAGLGLFAGWKPSSTRERLREGRPFDNPAGKEFLKTYDLFAGLRSLSMGSALRLRDPKYGPEGSREYLYLILDAAQKARPQLDPDARTLVDVETGITYVRLAMVEQAEGNSSASQTWMRTAQATLKQVGWKDCSDAHLRQLVQALNQQDACERPCGKH